MSHFPRFCSSGGLRLRGGLFRYCRKRFDRGVLGGICGSSFELQLDVFAGFPRDLGKAAMERSNQHPTVDMTPRRGVTAAAWIMAAKPH